MSELRPGLAAVRDLARSAQGVREAGELLDRICASVAETFGFGRAGISRFRPETHKLELLAAHGISAEEVRQLSSSLDDWRIFKRALEANREGKPAVLEMLTAQDTAYPMAGQVLKAAEAEALVPA